MRRSAGLLIPIGIILPYYGFWIGLTAWSVHRFPALRDYLPLDGITDLAVLAMDGFEPVHSGIEETLFSPSGPVRLAFASIGALILIVPVSWVYFITSRARRIDQSFLQTIMILPVVVTGIAMIAMNSLALAFTLAGAVAAVRFRFSLAQPSDAMYIFVAIGIGLGAGIGALGIATVISMAFVLATLAIWRLEYGKTLSGRFLSMLTRRDGGEDEY